MEFPKSWGWGAEGGMLHGLTDLCVLAFLLLECLASGCLSHSLKELKIYFLRGTSVTTLFPPQSELDEPFVSSLPPLYTSVMVLFCLFDSLPPSPRLWTI